MSSSFGIRASAHAGNLTSLINIHHEVIMSFSPPCQCFRCTRSSTFATSSSPRTECTFRAAEHPRQHRWEQCIYISDFPDQGHSPSTSCSRPLTFALLTQSCQKPIHSHNDYWRDVPVFTAISVGCVSIESDVWLYNDTLYVGHEPSGLTPARTFQSLTIEPILSILQRQNPVSPFVTSTTHNGVFDGYSSQTLYLIIDVKTSGETTWPYVVQGLQPLRDAGYLTTYDGTRVKPGPVTVIGSGNAPLDQIENKDFRDYFYDAPTELLETTLSHITSDVSPIASTDFEAAFGKIRGTEFNNTQLATLRSQIATANSKGILTRFVACCSAATQILVIDHYPRYWNQPEWPIATRNAIWSTLVQEGVGLLNVNDVVEAAGLGGINGYWG